MENLSGIIGYVAMTLVAAMDMRLPCRVAINHAVIPGTIERLPPVPFLYLVLNIVRPGETVGGTQAEGDRTQADGVVGTQTLRTDITSRGQPPAAHRPIFLSLPKTTRPA